MSNGAKHSRKYYVSKDCDAMIIEIEASAKASLDLEVNLSRAFRCTEEIIEDGLLKISGTLDSGAEKPGMGYAAYAKILTEGKNAVIEEGRVYDADKAWIIISAATSYFEGDDYDRKAREILAKATENFDPERTYAASVQAHKALYDRASVHFESDAASASLPAGERIVAYSEGAKDNHLAALYYNYGRYLLICSTREGSLPPNLQGLWANTYQTPWNGDYHFNINIQMCYWPAFHGNKLENLKPLFKMMKSWWPILQDNARKFCKIEDGFMLPHSVDDRCTLIGGYWLGTIDHGCTAWMAHLMFRYVQYSGDIEFLKSYAYPFMKGAMNVYRAIMEEYKGRLSIAATNSPEWWGDGPPDDAWGRDASFQLAACHRLCSDLIAAAELLGEKPSPMWLDVKKRLPQYSVAPQTSCVRHTAEEIGLFDGKRLPESHRHHSHMAGIVPFDTIDFECDEKTKNHVKETYTTWIQHGPGLWAGWSMPWASMLQTRIGMSDMAVYTLKTWKKFFNNPGHGSRHNPYYSGFSLIGKHPFDASGEGNGEIMQMDGAAASVAAIQELLCHERGGIVRLFVGAPKEWKSVSFENILVAGGFLVSAKRDNGVVTLDVRSTRAGVFRWQDPLTGEIRQKRFDGSGSFKRIYSR
jgi:hypothetical protein